MVEKRKIIFYILIFIIFCFSCIMVSHAQEQIIINANNNPVPSTQIPLDLDAGGGFYYSPIRIYQSYMFHNTDDLGGNLDTNIFQTSTSGSTYFILKICSSSDIVNSWIAPTASQRFTGIDALINTNASCSLSSGGFGTRGTSYYLFWFANYSAKNLPSSNGYALFTFDNTFQLYTNKTNTTLTIQDNLLVSKYDYYSQLNQLSQANNVVVSSDNLEDKISNFQQQQQDLHDSLIQSQNNNANQIIQNQNSNTDKILSTQIPGNDDFSNFLNQVNSNLPGNNVISALITIPLTFMNNVLYQLQSPQCSSFNLGSIFGANLQIPCIDLREILGTSIYNTIDIITTGLLCYYLSKKIINMIRSLFDLNTEKVMSNFYGGA